MKETAHKRTPSIKCCRNGFSGLLVLLGLAAMGVQPAMAQWIWTGDQSSDWFDDRNWQGGVPSQAINSDTIIDGESAHVVIEGASAFSSSSAQLAIGKSESGALLIVRDGGVLSSGSGGIMFAPLRPQVVIGDTIGSAGEVVVTGEGSKWTVNAPFDFSGTSAPVIGNQGSGTLTISNGGSVTFLGGAAQTGVLHVARLAGSEGAINIGAGEGEGPSSAGYLSVANGIRFGAGTGRVVFNHTNNDYDFGVSMVGDGLLDLFAGGTTFSKDSVDFTGAIHVYDGATLSGQGSRTIGDASSTLTVLDGGTLSVSRGGANTLTVGNLNLSNGSILNFELGEPDGDAGESGDLLVVQGDIVLDGQLVVADLGESFGDGIYVLIRYHGAITDNGLDVTSLPGGVNGQVEIAAGEVRLIVGALTLEESYWAPHSVFGGDGVWDNTASNWTDEEGADRVTWGEAVAVFTGDAGQVTVDGEVRFTRLRFEEDGYILLAAPNGVLTPNEEVLNPDQAPIIEVAGSSNSATVAVRIDAGTRGLRKDGNGSLVFAVDQDYVGLTDIRGGRLELGDGGSAGTVGGEVNIVSGTLAFNRSDDVVFNSMIRGNGRVEQIGSGTVTLTADNTYSGRTVIRDGVLQLGQGEGGGSSGWLGSSVVQVDSEGVLAINRSNNNVLGAELVGDGSVVHLGSGTTIFTADSVGFVGRTHIEQGTVVVSGVLGGDVDIKSSLLLTGGINGSVEVYGGGRISGTGSVGGDVHVHEAGVLSIRSIDDSVASGAPALNVAGDLHFDEGAGFEIGANRFGDADWVHVSGQAELNGTALIVEAGNPDAALWQPFNEYVILIADGGLVGTFGTTVQNNFAFLDPRLAYEGGAVTLHLDRSDVRFGDLPGLTPNQRATGSMIQSIEGLVGQDVEHPVVQALLPASTAQASSALSQLSGEIHASTRSVLLQDSMLVHDAIMAHAGSAANPGSRVWTRGLYHDADFEGDTTAHFSRSTAGLLIGADYLLGENAFTAGWAVGYHRGKLDGQSAHARGETNAFHAAAYTGLRWAAEDLPWTLPAAHSVGLRGGVSHSWHEIEMRRTVDLVGEALGADYDATSMQVAVEADLRFRFEDNEVAPFIGASWLRLSSDGFVEEASDTQPVVLGETAALQSRSSSDNLAFATVGVRGSMALGQEAFAPYGDRVRLHGMLGWRHVFSGDRPDMQLRLRDSAPGAGIMTIEGSPLATDALIADLGLRLRLGENGSVGLAWVGQMASEVTDHAVQARFEWRLD